MVGIPTSDQLIIQGGGSGVDTIVEWKTSCQDPTKESWVSDTEQEEDGKEQKRCLPYCIVAPSRRASRRNLCVVVGMVGIPTSDQLIIQGGGSGVDTIVEWKTSCQDPTKESWVSDTEQEEDGKEQRRC